MKRTHFLSLLLCPIAVGLVACGGDSTDPIGPPASVAAVQGSNNQSATVGQALPVPLSVHVADASGRGVGGVQVDFQTGSGSIAAALAPALSSGGSGGAAVIVTTNSDGDASATWTLPTTAGSHAATATVEGLSPVNFTANALPDVPASLAISGGNNQLGPVGSQLANPLAAQVLDQFSNGVPGETVDWAVTSGGGALSAPSSTTGPGGDALVSLTPQSTGSIQVSASLAGSAISPVVLSATGQAQIVDPGGDEFSTSASAGLTPPDVLRMTAWPEAGNLRIEIEMLDIISSDTNAPNAVLGFVDIDADQDPATGVQAFTDVFGGASGMGMDYLVQLSSGTPAVFNLFDSTLTQIGTINATFTQYEIHFSVPLAMLGGDEGLVDLATVVGTLPEPTDVAPNSGSLTMGSRQGAPMTQRATREPPAVNLGAWRIK